ncbi:MAG: TOBE domain-containing protein [Bacilli bacterium]|nr:TOBE domain-containing protein [Bacilli bacterium]
MGIRPENILEANKSDKDALDVKVRLSELLGDQYYIHFDFGGKDILSKISAEKEIESGSEIKLKFNKEKVHLFDVDSEITIY